MGTWGPDSASYGYLCVCPHSWQMWDHTAVPVSSLFLPRSRQAEALALPGP